MLDLLAQFLGTGVLYRENDRFRYKAVLEISRQFGAWRGAPASCRRDRCSVGVSRPLGEGHDER